MKRNDVEFRPGYERTEAIGGILAALEYLYREAQSQQLGLTTALVGAAADACQEELERQREWAGIAEPSGDRGSHDQNDKAAQS